MLRAIGHQLRTARENLGWSRQQLVAKLETGVHAQTVATYELAIRQCSIGRFVAICEALGLNAPYVLETAIRLAEADPHHMVCAVDLRAVVRDRDPALEPMRRWARTQLTRDPDSPVVQLEPKLVAELAMFCGLSQADLFNRITGRSAARELDQP
ncbi:helix-turn-helix transcriptional regulator [Actinokineospora auranticolor]|uniref:helix-turn-helix domain-containing protein n=1 Tax=Actinokineospora auranticolor TaxID=155976 RepID=UPI001FE74419|nr:helix-turn-helix transcriptional regulator [Actinokineospora auranticolor]